MSLLLDLIFSIPILKGFIGLYVFLPVPLFLNVYNYVLVGFIVIFRRPINVKRFTCNSFYSLLLNRYLFFWKGWVLFKNCLKVFYLFSLDCLHSLRIHKLLYSFLLFLSWHAQLFLKLFYFAFFDWSLTFFLFSELFFLITLTLEQVIFLLMEASRKILKLSFL